ncbi:MAG: hypothetical protein WA960_04480 [Tunicatimonas sp.]
MKRRILFVCLVLTACGDRNTSVIDQRVLNEMEQREPKRVMPNQLVEEAYRQGRTLANRLLASSLNRPSTDDSLSLATLLAQQSYDTVSARVVWIDHRSDTARFTAYEEQLWGAYRYSARQGDPLADNVQRLAGDSLLYTQPVVLADSLARRFPASPDTVGQLVGMWSITLPKREVVLGIK